MNSSLATQPWLRSAGFDLTWIIAPAFVATAASLAIAPFIQDKSIGPILWVLLILGIDVAHVWSTLYRTYLDPHQRLAHAMLLRFVPLACWGIGALLYSASALWFWRSLAYLAVFHFVRQQYGFFRLYARRDQETKIERRLGAACIYLATLYPLIWWHTHLPRAFEWFVPQDFSPLLSVPLDVLFLWIYLVIAAAYIFIEICRTRRLQKFNLPKNLWLIGTALSWFVGIVLFNNDLIFTLTNVTAHGIPYVALLWHTQNRTDFQTHVIFKNLFRPLALPAFLGFIFLLAYLEEGLWDGMVWREHTRVFSIFQSLPHLTGDAIQSLVVPLLALPQATHYVLDGFIWRLRHNAFLI